MARRRSGPAFDVVWNGVNDQRGGDLLVAVAARHATRAAPEPSRRAQRAHLTCSLLPSAFTVFDFVKAFGGSERQAMKRIQHWRTRGLVVSVGWREGARQRSCMTYRTIAET